MTISDTGFESSGHLDFPQLLTEAEIDSLRHTLNPRSGIAAGDRRVLDHQWCRDLASSILKRLESNSLVSGEYVAVLCTFFDKSDEMNWGVAPHRDVCVPMYKKFSLPGWSNWSEKQEIPHAQPPTKFIGRMFAVRINIDRCDRTNGGLLVASGSHISDRNCEPEEIVEGGPGDALIMSPLLVHSSRKSESGKPRRVLHFLFGPADIESPAQWFYAV